MVQKSTMSSEYVRETFQKHSGSSYDARGGVITKKQFKKALKQMFPDLLGGESANSRMKQSAISSRQGKKQLDFAEFSSAVARLQEVATAIARQAAAVSWTIESNSGAKLNLSGDSVSENLTFSLTTPHIMVPPSAFMRMDVAGGDRENVKWLTNGDIEALFQHLRPRGGYVATTDVQSLLLQVMVSLKRKV
jgi:hypothetical protein